MNPQAEEYKDGEMYNLEDQEYSAIIVKLNKLAQEVQD